MVTPAASHTPERRCAHCGSPSLAHRRRDAIYCSAPCRAAASRARAARTLQNAAEAPGQARGEESAQTRTNAPQPEAHPRPHHRTGVEAFVAAVIETFDAHEITSDDIPDDAMVVTIDARAWRA